MTRKLVVGLFLTFQIQVAFTQTSSTALTVQKIMQDPAKWIGTSPHSVYWGTDSQDFYFSWNPESNPGDSLYHYSLRKGKIEKAKGQSFILHDQNPYFNIEKAKKLYTLHGDLYEEDLKQKRIQQLTYNLSGIGNIQYAANGVDIYFTLQHNLIQLNRSTGALRQLTDFKQEKQKQEKKPTAQQEWLQQDQLRFFSVLEQRKAKKEQSEKARAAASPRRPRPIYIGDARISNQTPSPDGRYVSFRLLNSSSEAGSTNVPSYVTQSGYTENLSARSKVGSPQMWSRLGIYDTKLDTVYYLQTDDLPSLKQLPEFAKDYPGKKIEREQKVITHGPLYSKAGGNEALLEIRSIDNKDRWIGLMDVHTGDFLVLDHQRDEAWIGGPGIGWLYSPGEFGWMPQGRQVWFISEASGYAHLYTVDVDSRKKRQLTSGSWEVYDPKISQNDKYWYFHANKEHPGERHFYRMPLAGGIPEKLTHGEGRWDVTLSPDEKWMASLYSTANRPPELYLQANRKGATAKKLTHSIKKDWESYSWRVPEFITIPARDGAQVPARLYKPANGSRNGPAVIFVHGAGYLQNAHKWWSTYFREYMFHNLLVDKGYTVIDIDYRGSAGYGRDWRTGIYRHMGGKDLDDHVDAARWLVAELGVDSSRLGIYGGSYGGFITLMAMFKEPDIFKAGAALRSVTDWAHYNHPYTANILNEPHTDSLAYARSSPLYYAEGLKGHLLIAHGMIDTNVHFQDVVRLSQRLIELGKENWEMAVYPMEDHAFVEPSSWTDEYSRILKLFEQTIGSQRKEEAD